MNDLSKISSRNTSDSLSSSTPSADLEGGPLLSGWPASPRPVERGPDPAHASHSARQARALGLLTSGTFGQPSTGSLASVALTSSLASRLKARLAGSGSTLWQLTWKDMATPSGRRFFRLRASARPKSDIALTGWPAPTKGNAGGSQAAAGASATGRRGDGSKATVALPAIARLAGWQAPTMNDARGSDYTYSQGNHDKPFLKLPGEAKLATPARLTASGELQIGYTAETINGGQLNPKFSLWLQGFPPEWESCAPLVTRSASRKRKPSSRKS